MAKPKAIPNNFVVDARLIRAAAACVATKDRREFLLYVLIEPDGYVTGCNGTAAFRGRSKNTDAFDSPSKRLVLHLHGKCPGFSTQCQFEFIDADHGLMRCPDPEAKRVDALIAFDVQPEAKDHTYPDIKSLFPTTPPKNIKRIGFYGNVLGMTAKVFGKSIAAIYEFHGAGCAVMATPGNAWDDIDANLTMLPATMCDFPDDDGPLSTFGTNEDAE